MRLYPIMAPFLRGRDAAHIGSTKNDQIPALTGFVSNTGSALVPTPILLTRWAARSTDSRAWQLLAFVGLSRKQAAEVLAFTNFGNIYKALSLLEHGSNSDPRLKRFSLTRMLGSGRKNLVAPIGVSGY